MTNVIEFNTRKAASSANKPSKPSKSDIPPFSDFFWEKGSTYSELLEQSCRLQFADMWEALERDNPERIPEILEYTPDILEVLQGVVIAKEWQQKEVAMELLKVVEKYVKTGAIPTLAGVSPKARGFIYSPANSHIFVVQTSFG